ncbi:MAG: hypothetical protein PW789_19640 [Edaphobacter sp.]|uniref:helix-turn-helix transcriptional regulator n=1 Tax=Edaphobacter sp. TaxID=1934404 RepID=UPI00238BA899|nr:hypothetical protein [Edaphobacter sp.]MDE1178793.1 hypothetical protein [Edaphobacter sp.]
MFNNPEELFGGTRSMLALIDLIYAAAENASLWPVVLDRISELAGGREMFLASSFTVEGANIVNIARMDQVALKPYIDYYAGVNILSKRCDELYADGQARYSHRAVPDEEFERTEFCVDYFHPHDMHFSIGAKIPLGAEGSAYMACMRPKSQVAFDDRKGLLLEALVPHMQRAMRMHLRLAQLTAHEAGLKQSLDAFGHAVFGVDGRRRVVFMNRLAEEMLVAGDGLSLVEGRLQAVGVADDVALQRLLAGAVSSFAESLAAAVLVQRRSGVAALTVTAMPFTGVGQRMEPLAALVFCADPERRQATRQTLLRALYALSPVESRMVDLLVDGFDTNGAAVRLGMTQETARFYVKRVLAKVGVKRQSELVKRVLQLPGLG